MSTERMTRLRRIGTLAGSAALPSAALLTAAPASASPPPLTNAQATSYVRDLVKSELYEEIGRRSIRCQRRTARKQVCKLRWTSWSGTYLGTATITRSGIDTSPVDRYRITATGRSEYSNPERTTRSGRIAIDTRRAAYGQPLRLLGNDGEEIEITPDIPIDPFVQPTDYETVPTSTRFVAVKLSVKNVGRKRWDGSLYGARLIARDGRAFEGVLVDGCDEPPDMARGERRLGCIAFDVPLGVAIKQLEIPGGKETGVWK